MNKINQRYIIKYICEKLHYKQNEVENKIRDILNECYTEQHAKISRFLNNRGPGYDGLESGKFYDAFFKTNDTSSEHKKLNDFLAENEIDCSEFDPLDNLNYEAFVMNMLKCGLDRYQSDKTILKKETKIKEKTPKLHTQVFCISNSFTGRDELLKEIKEKLDNSSTAILCGVGGIGKTYLAKKYAESKKKTYKNMQEVVCDSDNPTFKQLILSIKFDNLNEQDWSEEEKISQRIKLLNDMDKSSLLIFDNIDKIPNDIDLFNDLRKNTGIHIIITTRLRSGFENFDKIIVDKLSYEEQLELFEYHLGYSIGDEGKGDVKKILTFIEGHTLAIELVAKSISKGELSYQEMLQALTENYNDEYLPSITYHDKQDKLGHIFKNLFNIAQLTDKEKEIMMYLSLIPTEGIARKIVIKYLCKGCVGIINNLDMRSWSICEGKENGNIIRLHPVIREIVKSEMQPTCENCNTFINNIREFIENTDSREYTDDLCKLCKSIVDTLNFLDFTNEESLRYLVNFAEFCNKNCYYKEALDIYKCALSVLKKTDKKVFSKSDLCEGELYIRIGQLFQRLAKYNRAIECFDDAANSFDDNTYNKARAFRKLGEVYRKKSQYDDALEKDIAALKIFEKNNEEDSLAEVQNAIGVVYLNMGDAEKEGKRQMEYYEKAKEYYALALRYWENSNRDINQMAFSYHNMGSLYYRLKDYNNALEYHIKGMKLRNENNLSKTDLAASYTWIGKDYLELNKYKLAFENIKKGMEIRKKYLGEKHPDYAWSLDTMSYYYEKTKDVKAATEAMLGVIEIRTNVLGNEHKYTQQAIERHKKLSISM